MITSSWEREMQNKNTAQSDAGQLVEDKFSKLWSDRTKTPAKVTIGVSEAMDYGAMKVSATVSLACDQNEPAINQAGELAFYKAVELMRDGWSELAKTTT